MREALLRLLRDSGRSIVGGLVLGLPLLYTMETWWLAWRLPATLLLGFALAGMLAIMVVVRNVGFRESEYRKSSLGETLREFAELVLHTLVGIFAVLLLFGVIDLETPPQELVRHAAVQLIPFGLGASIANRMMQKEDGEGEAKTMRKEAATFALGAVFFALPISPTEEMELMAAHAGWLRLVLVMIAALVLTYLALYELEFRGSSARAGGAGKPIYQVGEAFGGYLIALAVSTLLLWGYGHFTLGGWEEWVQKVVVLSLVASIGGAAARVVI